MGAAIQVSVLELHARTGHYIRKAADTQRVIVTDNGRPIAEIVPLVATSSVPFFARRRLRPAFQKMQEQGKLLPKAGDRDITDLISEDRD